MADNSNLFHDDKVLLGAVHELVQENLRRNREMFDGFNPVTGKGCPGERVPDEKDIPPLKEHELPGNTETAGLIREGRTGEGREGRLEPRSVRVVNTGMAAA